MSAPAAPRSGHGPGTLSSLHSPAPDLPDKTGVRHNGRAVVAVATVHSIHGAKRRMLVAVKAEFESRRVHRCCCAWQPRQGSQLVNAIAAPLRRVSQVRYTLEFASNILK